MTLKTLVVQINPNDLDSGDMYWLQKSLDVPGNYQGVDMSDMLDMLNQPGGFAFRLSGRTRGILVGRLVYWPNGTELIIWALAGQRLNFAFREIVESLTAWGREYGVRWVSMRTADPRLDRYVQERLATPSESRWYVMEVSCAN